VLLLLNFSVNRSRKYLKKNIEFTGALGGWLNQLSLQFLISAQVLTSGLWVQAPCWAPRPAWSPLKTHTHTDTHTFGEMKFCFGGRGLTFGRLWWVSSAAWYWVMIQIKTKSNVGREAAGQERFLLLFSPRFYLSGNQNVLLCNNFSLTKMP